MNDFNVQWNINVSFMKFSSDYKVLKGDKYEVGSIDGDSSIGVFTTEEEYGDHHFGPFMSFFEVTSPITSEKVFSLLPKVIRDELSHIQTKDDFTNFENLPNIFVIENRSFSNYDSLLIRFDIPVKFNHVKTAPGTQKHDIVFIGHAEINYQFAKNGNIMNKQFHLDLSDHNHEIIYNSQIPSIKNLSDLSQFNPESFSLSCMNTDNQGRIILDSNQCSKTTDWYSSTYSLVPYFIAENGTVKFEIKNTVNGLTKYNANKNKDLNYKVTVSNNGNASSGDNIITTKVPKELKVNQNSISNGGVYHRESNSITWNVKHIEAGETINLTYSAVAPKSVNGKELISNSSIYSSYAGKTTYSNSSIVTLDRIVEIIDNPNTGSEMIYIPKTNIGIPLVLLFSIALIICITLFVIKFSRSNKSTDNDRGIRL